jgi:ribosome-binding protein aMBF1 (putative translation factor)
MYLDQPKTHYEMSNIMRRIKCNIWRRPDMSKDVQKLVGRNVAAIRQTKLSKMTQAALADKIDVDRAYISALERAESGVNIR